MWWHSWTFLTLIPAYSEGFRYLHSPPLSKGCNCQSDLLVFFFVNYLKDENISADWNHNVVRAIDLLAYRNFKKSVFFGISCPSSPFVNLKIPSNLLPWSMNSISYFLFPPEVDVLCAGHQTNKWLFFLNNNLTLKVVSIITRHSVVVNMFASKQLGPRNWNMFVFLLIAFAKKLTRIFSRFPERFPFLTF